MVYLGTNDLWIESPFKGTSSRRTRRRTCARARVSSSVVWGRNVDSNPDTVLVHKRFTYGTFFPSDP
jgi:hypothetical protein